MTAREILEAVLDLLYPPKCPFCRKLLTPGSRVCACTATLRPAAPGPLRNAAGTIDKCIAPFSYEGPVRESLHRYKFSGTAAYAEHYAVYLQKTVDESGVSCDSIAWVPLSKKRRRSRGYDQAELLARAVAERMGIPCEALLEKLTDNMAQSGVKSADERAKNVSGVYAVREGAAVDGKRILLVDDIITSGATTGECAKVLKKNGAAFVCALAVARTPELHRN